MTQYLTSRECSAGYLREDTPGSEISEASSNGSESSQEWAEAEKKRRIDEAIEGQLAEADCEDDLLTSHDWEDLLELANKNAAT